jgi:hypothetical protein
MILNGIWGLGWGIIELDKMGWCVTGAGTFQARPGFNRHGSRFFENSLSKPFFLSFVILVYKDTRKKRKFLCIFLLNFVSFKLPL